MTYITPTPDLERHMRIVAGRREAERNHRLELGKRYNGVSWSGMGPTEPLPPILSGRDLIAAAEDSLRRERESLGRPANRVLHAVILAQQAAERLLEDLEEVRSCINRNSDDGEFTDAEDVIRRLAATLRRSRKVPDAVIEAAALLDEVA